MRNGNGLDARKKGAVALAVCAAVLVFGGDCFGAENIIDGVIETIRSSASGWGDHIRGASLRLFGYLAVISLVWNMGRLLYAGDHELMGFFNTAVYWIITTGTWLFLLRNGPSALSSVIATFQEMGGGSGAITPSRVLGNGVDSFATLMRHMNFPTATEMAVDIVWEGGDVGAIIPGLIDPLLTVAIGGMMLMAAAVIGVSLALQLANAYMLVYGGYFFLSFAGGEWTRPMAQNYFRSVLVAGCELLCTLLAYGLFSGIFDNLVADFLGTVAGSQEGIKTQNLMAILMAMVMCAYFIFALPKLLGRIVKTIVTSINLPLSYENAKMAGTLIAGGAAGAAKILAEMAAKELGLAGQAGSKAAGALKRLVKK